MGVDAIVIVSTPHATPMERRSLDAAMQRRGWTRTAPDRYAASFTEPCSDEWIVNEIERDVKGGVYVAGIGEFEAVCLLSESDEGESVGEEDTDLNFDLL